MYGPEQRQSHRVPFQVPARIVSPRPLVAILDDLSRTGSRIHVRVKDLGLEVPTSLADLARCVQERIGATFELELHYEALGPLLTKSATLVRIGISPEDPERCQLACAFDLPLSNEETVMLGVALPLPKGTPEDWIPRADTPGPIAHQTRAPEAPEVAQTPATPSAPATAAPPPPAATAVRVDRPAPTAPARPATPAPAPKAAAAPAPAADPKAPLEPSPLRKESGSSISRRVAGGAANRWRAFVSSVDKSRSPILSCTMDEICSQSVRVKVWRGPGGSVLDGADPATVGVAFIDNYGDQVGLKIMDGASHIWTGPTRVRAVEVPRGRQGEVFLTLAFDRSLTSRELQRLGLA